MWRALSHPVFPFAALLFGAAVATAAYRFDLSVTFSAVAALGLGATAMALALRNWKLGEIERPLLAEELDSLHDALDEIDDLSRIASKKRDAVTRQSLEAIEQRLAAAEDRIAALRSDLPNETATRPNPKEADSLGSTDATRIEPQLEEDPAAIQSNEHRPLIVAPRPADKPTPSRRKAREIAVDKEEREAARIQLQNHRNELSTLRSAAEEMRQPAPKKQSSSRFEPFFETEPQSAVSGAAFDPTLDDERYELMLQAVYRLRDREPRFFEAVTRAWVRGEILAPTAHHVDAAKSGGYVDAVDNMAIVKCVEALRVLRKIDPRMSIFCNISMETLRSDAFLTSLLGFLGQNQGLGERLVIELRQNELRKLGEDESSILAKLRDRGFSFSLDHAGDWSFDPRRLGDIGFRFVKLDAASALSREAASPGALSHLRRAIERAGMDVIAEKIEKRSELEALVESGVRYGQGRALSEPRKVDIACENLTLERRRRQALSRREMETEKR